MPEIEKLVLRRVKGWLSDIVPRLEAGDREIDSATLKVTLMPSFGGESIDLDVEELTHHEHKDIENV